VVDCSALAESLVESELFGHERGAFTGALSARRGLFETAAGGTCLLDEVGELSAALQAKLLRALQEQAIRRVGGNDWIPVDVRMIAATNRDLRARAEEGTFREDLYYRINVFTIQLPPLRERRDDILALSETFLVEIGRSIGRPPSGISREAREALVSYAWPGNVRELRNILERAAILSDGGLIVTQHLGLSTAPQSPGPDGAASPTASDLPSTERAMIEKALIEARFNKSQAAKTLGLSRAQLYVRLKRHGLE